MANFSPQDRRTRGTAYVLLMRFNNERLPRALELKALVDRGERLSEYDMTYLKRVLSEADAVRQAANQVPEYRKLVSKMGSLYEEITRKALENEQKPAPIKKKKKPLFDDYFQ